MELFKKTHIDFIHWRYVPIMMSLCIVAFSSAAIIIKGFNYSIEFTGGALIQVTYKNDVTLQQVREAIAPGAAPAKDAALLCQRPPRGRSRVPR